MRTRRRVVRRGAAPTVTPAAVLAVAVLVAACTGPSPAEELAEAVEATAATAVVFELVARADRAALDALGDGAGAAASFLDDAAVTGARTPDGRTQLELAIGPGAPLLEVVTGPDEDLSLRAGLADLLPVGDADPADELDPVLADLGVGEPGRRALAASFAGEWVAVSDLDDLGELLGAAGDAAGRDLPPPLGTARLLAAVTVSSARDAGDVRRLEVEVDVDALLGRATGEASGGDPGDAGAGAGPGASPPLPGTVVLRDGVVQEVRLELAGDALGDAGAVTLVLTVTPASGDPVPRPDPAARLTAGELNALVDALGGGSR